MRLLLIFFVVLPSPWCPIHCEVWNKVQNSSLLVFKEEIGNEKTNSTTKTYIISMSLV